MLLVRPAGERGHADHGWLDTYHTFSFAQYRDPDFMGFGALRVLNQDRVAPGQGFGTHGHADMEIVSFVLAGVLEHKDSLGNGSRIRPGDVQLMSAGTGVTHSEFNGSRTETVEFLQMWVIPARRGTAPRYEQRHFSEASLADALKLVVSPDGREDSLTIGQDALLFVGRLGRGRSPTHALDPERRAWLHVARGSVVVNGVTLGPGDGAAIQGESELRFEAREDTELVLFDLA